MDCPNIRQLLAYRRPGGPPELAPEDASVLDRHLAGCPSCASAARRQDGFDAALGAAMQAVTTPVGLRDRLLTDALARSGAIWRRTVYQYVTAAAILVMTALTTAGVGLLLRPTFDTDQVAAEFGTRYEVPEPAVRNFLSNADVPLTLPRDFNFALFDGIGYEKIEGRMVPWVQFRLPPQPGANRPDSARVLIVRKSRFKLDTDRFRTTQNSFFNVLAIPDNGQAVGYVILFTTPKLDIFLNPTVPTF
jgi:hypothetical protein